MGMGGGGAGGAIGAHVHDNNAGQGGNLTTATLLESVTLESRLDPNPATVNEDTVTVEDTTTSTTLVSSSCSFSVPNDDKDLILVAQLQGRTDSAGSLVLIGISGGDNQNALATNTHDTAGRTVAFGTTSTGTQTGQTCTLLWAVGAGNGRLFVGTNMFGFGVGA